MAQTKAGSAGVIVLPPLVSLVALLLSIGLDWLVPLGAIAILVPFTARVSLAVLIGALGIWVAARGVMQLSRLQTAVDPPRPVAALATTGIFGRTRNPLYQSQGLLLLALGVGFASDWTVLLLMPWAIAMHLVVVLPEERYLEEKFGNEYRRYKAAVPRYGWPF